VRIAIVDDCKEDLDLLKKYISDYIGNDFDDIDVFENGEKLLSNFEPNKYNIVFLDIYMTGITGIDTARKIFHADKECKIVFLTMSNSFAAESYEVEAAGYIIKPINKVKIENLLNKYLYDFKENNKYIDLVSAKDVYHIALKDIIYADTLIRTVRIHLCDRVIKLNEGFHEKTAPLLDDNRFIECYRCVIVNMDHVVKIQGDDFIMDNNETIPIRKRNKKEVHKAYMRYKIDKM